MPPCWTSHGRKPHLKTLLFTLTLWIWTWPSWPWPWTIFSNIDCCVVFSIWPWTELWPLTFDSNLAMVKVDSHAKSQGPTVCLLILRNGFLQIALKLLQSQYTEKKGYRKQPHRRTTHTIQSPMVKTACGHDMKIFAKNNSTELVNALQFKWL